jgi:phage replication-related protein YjqB (UPF0714/DUF867 family)
MPDKHMSYFSLKNNYREGVDYRVTVFDRGGRALVLAPHGGGIEFGTSELAAAVAGDALSLYLFEGLMEADNQKLHITSTHFDEGRCLELMPQFQTSLAIHGCDGAAPMIFVGGCDQDLKTILTAELSRKGHPVQLGTEVFAGSYRTNICNRTASGKGVQLELSSGLRRSLFVDWRTRLSRKTTTPKFEQLTADIRACLI